ncbi:MAG: DUF1571 domain-containing protein [Planctomycetaceae bacterium]
MSYRFANLAGTAGNRPRLIVTGAALLIVGAAGYATRSDNPLLDSRSRLPAAEAARPSAMIPSADLSRISWADSNPDFPPDSLVEGQAAFDENMRRLEAAMRRLEATPGYTATFHRRERVAGRLLDHETISVAVRHAPYSVYMKWLDEGAREVLFVEGENGGRMVVRLAGWKGRMLPAIRIAPDSSKAMEFSRHPASEFGLLEICRHLISDRRGDAGSGADVRWRMAAKQRYEGRECTYFRLEYGSPHDSEAARLYRKSVQIIDDETSLPIWVANYGWPAEGETFAGPEALDAATLLEHYVYADLDLAPRFSPDEFDRANPAYGFQR